MIKTSCNVNFELLIRHMKYLHLADGTRLRTLERQQRRPAVRKKGVKGVGHVFHKGN
jgi:hypothetical protein